VVAYAKESHPELYDMWWHTLLSAVNTAGPAIIKVCSE
jgi:hypothetical protein